MKTGMMNSPGNMLAGEINYAGENRFDFIDLTMEPPGALIAAPDVPDCRDRIKSWNLDVVGHTAYYLPLVTPFKGVQRAVHTELIRQLDLFRDLGAEKITVHMNFSFPVKFFDFKSRLSIWADALGPLLEHCRGNDQILMIENTLPWQGYLEFYKALFNVFPALRFHLDIGHANLVNPQNDTRLFCKHFSGKLRHVHVSDNLGGYQDLHLPLGTGNINWLDVLGQLVRKGYNETITLEVFSRDRDYLLFSREKLIRMWNRLQDTGD